MSTMTRTTSAPTGTEEAGAAAEEILQAVEEQFGFRPNLIEEMVRSPAAAQVYLGGQGAMEDASLTGSEQQAVQLAVAAFNHCHYCTAAHSGLARQTGVDVDDVEAILEGGLPEDDRTRALVKATRLVLEKHGWLDADNLEELEAAGVDRAELYEIVALVGLKTISNYVNHIAGTEVDPQFG